MVRGVHDVSVRFSRCCAPLPGDEIIGFVTRGRGISIHRTDCVNVMGLTERERGRLIEAEWDKKAMKGDPDETYLAEINIYANNRSGLLVDISKVFTEAGLDIRSINSKAAKNGVMTVTMGFEIHNTAELEGTVNKLRRIESVIDIERTSG